MIMTKENNIFVNQIGYKTVGQKFAYVKASDDVKDFAIVDADGKTVFTAALANCRKDELSPFEVVCADFSSFSTPGVYFVQAGNEKSHCFKIADSVYDDLYFSTLNYYYLSRCGEEIVDRAPANNGVWSRPACHTSVAEIYGEPGKTKAVLGGWHDAGDYGRYVVAGTKTIMDILFAYEFSRDSFDRFDILDEMKFELKWLLQMQREDGAVYHKISCYHFCAFINPQDEKDAIVLAPISTTATADFAGCLAYASKFYKDAEPEFAAELVGAAKKAMDYLNSHEDTFYQNPPEITTGGYGDGNVSDEKYFANASMFALTGDKSYLEAAKNIRFTEINRPVDPNEKWPRRWFEAYGWGFVSGYGTEILLKNANLIEDKDFVEDLRKGVITRADSILKAVEDSSFDLGIKRVFWGSNGQVCDEAHILFHAYDLTGNEAYKKAAEKQLNYILGCNPLDLCYVTGFGTRSTVSPHHRPSGATGVVMPGMVAGGPSAGLQDAVAKKYLEGKAPLCCYIDMQGSYSTNEVAIYWNSPLLYVIARVR